MKNYKHLLLLSALAVPIGLFIGLIETIFGKGIELFTSFRTSTIPLIWYCLLPLAGIITIWLYKKCKVDDSSVMNNLFHTYKYDFRSIPFIHIPLAIGTTWLAHLCGASVGREGVAVKVGGIIGSFASRYTPTIQDKRILTICGMAAGFSGLFLTPFAATFFVIEIVISGILDYHLLLPALISSFSAYTVSSLAGMHSFTCALPALNLNITTVVVAIGCAILFGLIGGLFGLSIEKLHVTLYKQFKNPYRIIVLGAIVIAVGLILTQGRYAGLSESIQHAAFYNSVNWYDFIGKFVFTVACLSVGFKGGEVAPLFIIGSTLGALLSSFLPVDQVWLAALGYICVFASGTNTIIAPLLLAGETFGFANIPLFIVCIIIARFFNFSHSIYHDQADIDTLLCTPEHKE